MVEAVTMAMQKALIVDDSRTAQIKLQRMLRPYPLETVTADSAEEALEYLNGQHPAVIFMDHSMPGMDGLEALKVIRSNSKTAALPVIMYTAQKGDVYIGRAQAAGANEVLSKDVMDEQGLEKVLAFLRLARTEKPARKQNVTSISGRLAGFPDRSDESRAIAMALSGRTSSGNSSSTCTLDTDTDTDAAVAASSLPLRSETTNSESSEESLEDVTNSYKDALQDAIKEMKELVQKHEKPSYLPPAPQANRSDNIENARPIWPSVFIVGLLLFVVYQLVEIRNDQNALDQAVREIQLQMEGE